MRTPSLRAANERLVLECLSHGDASTRAELAASTSLTPQALGPILAGLIADGLVLERRRRSNGLGRPPTEYLLDPNGAMRALIVVRFSDVVVAVRDAADALVGVERTRHDAGGAQPTRLLRRAFRLLDQLIARSGRDPGRLSHVRIAIEGRVDTDRGVVHETPVWRARDTCVDEIARRLLPADVAVSVEGHAHALAASALDLARLDDGELAVIIQLNHDVHLYVASGGTLVTGRSGRTGDLAHLPVPGNDRRCECGKSGCLRTVSSGHAVVTAYEELTGERLPAAVDVIERVAARDPHAITAVRRSVDWLAVALAPLLGVLAPDRILLTGAVGASDSGGVAYLTEAIREAVERPDLPIEVVHPGFSTVDLTRALTA